MRKEIICLKVGVFESYTKKKVLLLLWGKTITRPSSNIVYKINKMLLDWPWKVFTVYRTHHFSQVEYVVFVLILHYCTWEYNRYKTRKELSLRLRKEGKALEKVNDVKNQQESGKHKKHNASSIFIYTVYL